MVYRDADFASEVHRGVSGEGDDVGRGGVAQEIFMKASDSVIVEKDDGQLAFGDRAEG